jgi:alpha-D-ribose 1-methylphosphonate 5-triphosphate diphosphatase
METILTNARLLTESGMLAGTLVHADGVIRAAEPGRSHAPGAVDLEGDFLAPGLIECHTDNLERHFLPRPNVIWPNGLAAALGHDSQMAAAGVTTVYDAVSVGFYDSRTQFRKTLFRTMIDAVRTGVRENLFRLDHRIHLRCELSDPGLIQELETDLDLPLVKLASLMDHTPGQRQWHNTHLYREFRRKKNSQVWTDEEFDEYLAGRRDDQTKFVVPGRAAIGALGRARNIRIASHDDTTVADVEESYADGIAISEFPTTLEAARRAREFGMQIVMGAPNVVLGRSHSGNASAASLADVGLLDLLTSDYVPASLLHAPFILADRGMPLHEAVAKVTANPADSIGMADRGRLKPGLRADLLRVRLVGGQPVIRGTWVAGRA